MKKKGIIWKILAFSLCCYTFGAITVQYQLFPYKSIINLKNRFFESAEKDTLRNISNTDDIEILNYAFTEEVIAKDNFIYEPVNSIDELGSKINNYWIELNNISSAFDRIKISETKFIEPHIFQLTYEYGEKFYQAYSYFKPAESSSSNVQCGVNIIPGSGINQSSKIYYDDPKNYQENIDNITVQYCDTYIFVKPNEDFLALYNGTKKVNNYFVVNYLLNEGSSYSAYYFISSIALTKFLKEKYEKTVVAGLSQGGFISLLNSLQSEPDLSIVASGFSVLTEKINYSGHDQIIIPNIRNIYSNKAILNIISNSKTFFVFTYGEKESAFYKLEASKGYTSKEFQGFKNAVFAVHDLAHSYSPKIIHQYFSKYLNNKKIKEL